LDYVLEEAKKQELQSIHLDSGHQRHDAHRLYLNFGFSITSHHFAMELKSSMELQNVQGSDTTEVQ
jgi:hypothetical protein